MNAQQTKLLAAFEAGVSAQAITTIFFAHPNAPSLLMTRNPETLPQVVPVLLAHTPGSAEANTLLGADLSVAADGCLPLCQGINDGRDFHAVMAPFLFYRGVDERTYLQTAAAACETLHRDGRLTCWCIVRGGISYLTKDGKSHRVEDYPHAFAEGPR